MKKKEVIVDPLYVRTGEGVYPKSSLAEELRRIDKAQKNRKSSMKRPCSAQSPSAAEPSSKSRASPSRGSKRAAPSQPVVLSDGRRMEIVSDSSNDAFTYLCSHRNVCKFDTSTPGQSAPGQPVTPSGSQKEAAKEVALPKQTAPPAHTSAPLPLPSSPLTHCGDFAISDYIIITSSLSAACLDRIRTFASRFSVLWMQDFPHQTSLVDATNPGTSVSLPVAQPPSRGRSRRKESQRFILVIRSKDGWCKRTVKYLYGLA